MPRGSKPGERRGGRKKGTPNKPGQEIAAKLAALGCDPIEGMAKIALGDVDCPFCQATGTVGEAACGVCLGTGKEPVKADLKGKMYAELAQYTYPKRKAIEVSGPDGGDIRHDHTLSLHLLTDEQLAELEAIAESLDADKDGEKPRGPA